MNGAAVLEAIREFRSAAREIARADDSLRVRLLAAMSLMDRARELPDAEARSWCERAIWSEVATLTGADGSEPAIPADAMMLAARVLRAKGYVSCPTCAHPLAGEMDFARWADLRHQMTAEAEARERAVDHD